MDLRQRIHDAERMDEPDVPVAEMRLALEELDSINAWLGGFSTSLSLLRSRLLSTEGPVRLLDVGAGGGGTARFLRSWAEKREVDLRITLLDIHSAVCSTAAEKIRGAEALGLVRGDAFRLPFADDSFTYTHSALFLHHFRNAEIVTLLAEMRRVASEGIVVNDLERHPLAYHAIRLLSRVFVRSPIVRNDAPLSVRRGFRSEELENWSREERLAGLGFRRRWPYRWAGWVFEDGGTPERASGRV